MRRGSGIRRAARLCAATGRRAIKPCYEGVMKLLTLAGSLLAVTATAVAGGLATDPDSDYDRNLVKRRLREICRARRGDWQKGFDAVFVARSASQTAAYADLETAVRDLMRRAGIVRPDVKDADVSVQPIPVSRVSNGSEPGTVETGNGGAGRSV